MKLLPLILRLNLTPPLQLRFNRPRPLPSQAPKFTRFLKKEKQYMFRHSHDGQTPFDEWPGPVGTLILTGVDRAIHERYDQQNYDGESL